MKEQKLIKVGAKERHAIALTTSTNRRIAQNWDRELRRRKGPAACTYCGKEPCGVLWTRPGEPEPGGERCCDHCSHEPVEGWQHTHTAWAGGQTFPVCALTMHEGEVIYLRRDGMVQFVEMRAPKVGGQLGAEPEQDVPAVAFLGAEVDGAGLHPAGEGGERSTSLWSNQQPLDTLWLQVRMQSAVARDVERRLRRMAERKAKEDEHDRRVAELIAQEQAERDTQIAKRQLKHETRIVLDEMELGQDGELSHPLASEGSAPEAPVETPDGVRLVRHIRAEGPDPQTLCGRNAREVRLFEGVEAATAAEQPECCKHCGRCARPELYTPPEEPPRRLSAEELKQPAAPKATGGRLKRSGRQRRALERQKRAWARQEAKSRLEVKRLERAARASDRNLVEGDE